MTSFPLRFDWLCRHRRSVQGLERLWRPTPAIRAQQQPVRRRRWTLLTITICLHVLLWSSVIPLITMLALFAAQSIDTTILPSTVLTIVSAVASISYIALHAIVARRQNKMQYGVTSRKFENACYVAIRLAVTLCILWLMTSGWNLIIAARQPVCISESTPDGKSAAWKVGSSCVAERFSAAISFIALVASCILFGILAVVRRPFEASLFGPSSALISLTRQDHYTRFYRDRKLSHPEDGIYHPSPHRSRPSTSTLTSLTASSSLLRPDTAMTEKTGGVGHGIAASLLSTPGPSFPSTPSTGNAANPHFSWVPTPRTGSRNSSNGLGISTSPPAGPVPALTSTTVFGPPLRSIPAARGTRRTSSAESVMQTLPSSYTPATHQRHHRRSRSYGHPRTMLASGALVSPTSPCSPPSPAAPATPPRAARSPPPLDSAWRAVHPHPPPPSAGALKVPRARARPPSLPQFSPPLKQGAARRDGVEAPTRLTTAALASLTAAQQQQQQRHQPSPSSPPKTQQRPCRRGQHRRTPSGPPPAMPPSVRPVVDDGVAAASSSSPLSAAAMTSTPPRNPAPARGQAPAAPPDRPSTPVNRTAAAAPAPAPAPHSLRCASPALLSLQQRAARQRPLGLRPRASFGRGSQYSGSSGRSVSSSPLSTMVRACEVEAEAEALREESRVAEGVGSGVFGGGDGGVLEGVERTGRWCRVRRMRGRGGLKVRRKAGEEEEGEEGDLGVEGRNWVRSASGEESVSEGGEGKREREDSGVNLEGSSSAESCGGGSVGELTVRKSRGLLLPPWNGGVGVGATSSASSPEQSFLEAVLAAGKVTPLLLQQQQVQQQVGGEPCFRSASSPGDDATAPVGGAGLSRSGTIVIRRARSLEELQQQGLGMVSAAATHDDRCGAMPSVGLGLSWVISAHEGATHASQKREASLKVEKLTDGRSEEVRRVPRTRRRTVGQR